MDTVISTNILFITLSISVALMTVGFSVLIIYIVLILKNIYALSKIVKEDAQKITNDIDNIRAAVKKSGMEVKSFIVSLLSFFKKKKKSSGD